MDPKETILEYATLLGDAIKGTEEIARLSAAQQAYQSDEELKAKITVDAWNGYSTLQSCLQGDYGYGFSDYEGYLFSSVFVFRFESHKYPHTYYGKTYPRYHFIQA